MSTCEDRTLPGVNRASFARPAPPVTDGKQAVRPGSSALLNGHTDFLDEVADPVYKRWVIALLLDEKLQFRLSPAEVTFLENELSRTDGRR